MSPTEDSTEVVKAMDGPVASPTQIVVTHPSNVSAADVLGIVNDEVDEVAPVVIQAIPGTSSKVSAYVVLGEMALASINAIVQKIHAKANA